MYTSVEPHKRAHSLQLEAKMRGAYATDTSKNTAAGTVRAACFHVQNC